MGVPVTKLGRYTLVRSLGAGGMAELFLARAEGIGGFAKLVALKRILSHKATNEKFIRMLVNEARLVATLDHPNIAQVYDIGLENNEYFFAMEYVHGQDLRHVLHAAPERKLQLENALHVAIGVLAGLHHAHEARDPDGRPAEIVHRDVSPSNVIISYQGAVKLVDFGVAKAASMVSETREGIIKGKYGYMSPEQCLGQGLDRRSDLFAVGILLWEMTVGRRLYKVKGDLVTLQRVVYVDAPRPSRFVENYPPELERIVMRALCRDPEGRYETAEQMQIELENFAVNHRFAISAVSMAMEMRQLFRQRVDAWQEAQQRGRSLADHLAELSSEDALGSSNDDDDGALDAVLEGLEFTGATAPVTVAQRPAGRSPQSGSSPALAQLQHASGSSLAQRRASTAGSSSSLASLAPGAGPSLAPPIAAPPRRSGLIPLLVLFALAAAGVAVWALVFRAPATQPAPTPPQPPQLAAAPQQLDAGEAAAQPDTPMIVQPDAEPEEIEFVVPIDAAEEDGDKPDTKPNAKGGKKPDKKSGKTGRHDKPDPPVDKPPVDKPPVDKPPVDRPVDPPRPPPDAAIAIAPPDAPAGPKPGTVDAAGVRAVVKSHVGEISECVSRAKMENRDLAGKITLRINLAPSGKVTSTAVAASTGATPALEACMKKAVAGWTFPAPAGNTSAAITYPFVF